MTLLTVNALSKKFKANDFYSLQDATFTVNEGDIVGLVGKNGAGKSTLLKLLTKALRPSHGSILFEDKDINVQANVLDDFGIMIEPVFYPHLTVEDNLDFFLNIHDKKEYSQNIESTLKLVDLWEVRKRKPKNFSFGMKQRTALAIALVTEPKFILLDEPFVGLDPVGVNNLIEILKQWSIKNKTSMIISSHQLKELESICNRYIFIDAGHIKKQISNLEQPSQMSIILKSLDDKTSAVLEELVRSYQLHYKNDRLIIPNSLSNQDLNEVLGKLAAQDLIAEIEKQEDELENLFVED
ncbi:ABC transporter ATP-binding protein [Bombilactobacillus thymidiniphilus]|uniref:ABC transporter ATP-binding protein n=1 Tax=Bombilactobacillus thymidiniphilus TaxID=2923363 RepID=A0ABY4PCU2_9LACO|nr:ABC transporter ATP-binding protein [Bombilactobacillus thymidiniphilus]UQS83097.1 ABC transporter ATP-binding protein [Bombilactobacillus thymidiniphilus]